MYNTFWSKKPKKAHFDFWPKQKTSSKWYHSNQSPILKFSPSNCLNFLIYILLQKSTISELNSYLYSHTPISPCWPFWFLAVNSCKIKYSFFWHFGYVLQPQVNKKTNMTKINQIEHFQTHVHTFRLLMPMGDFSPPYIVESTVQITWKPATKVTIATNHEPLPKKAPAIVYIFFYCIHQQNSTISELQCHLYNHIPISSCQPY